MDGFSCVWRIALALYDSSSYELRAGGHSPLQSMLVV